MDTNRRQEYLDSFSVLCGIHFEEWEGYMNTGGNVG